MPVLLVVLCDKPRNVICIRHSLEMTIILKAKNTLIILWASLGRVKDPYNFDVLRVYS
jgi:hypothetical protein